MLTEMNELRALKGLAPLKSWKKSKNALAEAVQRMWRELDAETAPPPEIVSVIEITPDPAFVQLCAGYAEQRLSTKSSQAPD